MPEYKNKGNILRTVQTIESYNLWYVLQSYGKWQNTTYKMRHVLRKSVKTYAYTINIRSHWHEKKSYIVFFIDMEKAHDQVPRDMLRKALTKKGIHATYIIRRYELVWSW